MAGNQHRTSSPQLWGGVECTVNRVGDNYLDQLERSGHAHRPEDLDRFAALGIKTLRYPLLWERIAPAGLSRATWDWADQRVERLNALGITPIAGLIHHGSGPRHTNLLDPAFPLLLAEYAGGVARRYPHISLYTPVNEPLTTARFSGLYGHWYPHAREPRAFARALLHQCRAVVLAMERIREVNPRAQLVQTDDLGKVFSTRLLAYQAKFENERRWLTYDLLCGRVDPEHPLWNYLRRDAGVSAGELEFFIHHPCPPDIIGVNYYLTSERLLDERIELYPPATHGGNGRHMYADVEAVRLRPEGLVGPGELLAEAWERYGIPIAITEVHNGCTRDEQLRWLVDVWDAAVKAKASGVGIRAVTLWALLGAFDWNSLVTRSEGFYEPGAFDVRSPTPRPTALAKAARELAAGARPNHPVLDMPGWWRRSKRILYTHSLGGRVLRPSRPPTDARPILITGATGTLGQAFARRCELRGLAYRLLSRSDMDIADEHSVTVALALHGAWAVVNTAGYVRVDDAEHDRERCFRENAFGPAILARVCRSRDIRLVTFSSDLVFDGASTEPYVETSPTAPLNVYGESKAEAEREVLAACPDALLVRTSAFFGPWDEHNFVTRTLRTLKSGLEVEAADDLVVSPTYVPDLVDSALDLLIDAESGIWHLANEGAVTWAELARVAAVKAGLDPAGVVACHHDKLALIARRPGYSVLASDRGKLMPTLEQALDRFILECGLVTEAASTDTATQRPA
ncbi:MAG TPA: family 1 glycosylhydrolase [Gemmatimonadales bacterium]|nr:family 1 glycosylhydrolase [Gemmatimonadales bacterium]